MRTMVALLSAVGLLICGGCKTITIPDWIGGATNAVPDAGTVTTTPTTTTTQPPAAASDYKITRVTASDIFWTGPDLTWPEKDGCCGEAHLNGHKFDHIRRNSKQRDWKNIHGVDVKQEDGTVKRVRYGAFNTLGEPADGAACTLELVSYDGKQRVTVGTFKWIR